MVIIMKNIFYIVIFLFCFKVGKCQSVSGKIVYKVQLVDFAEGYTDQEYKDLNEAVVKISNMQTCTLLFNEFQSSFILDKNLISDNDNDGLNKMARVIAYSETIENDCFIDKKNNSIFNRSYGGKIIEKENKILNWELTKETKKIDGHLCYKAIYFLKFINRKGINTSIPIYAWFAPSLPYSYGPKYFNGLPGLILELQDRGTTFYATSISILKDKELVIEFPKGKTISQEDYTKKGQSN